MPGRGLQNLTPMQHRGYECRHSTEAALSEHTGSTHKLAVVLYSNGRTSTAVTAASVLFGHAVSILTDHAGSSLNLTLLTCISEVVGSNLGGGSRLF
jgi:hypothetical protein